MKPMTPPMALATLILLTACGGGSGSSHSANSPSTPAPATTLVYSNPTASGFSLQADPASNGTAHLVLNLVGPAGLQTQGVSFFLSCDPAQATWSKGSGTPAYASNGSVFTLGAAPQPFLTQLSGGDLQVGIYQISGVQTLASAPLVSVALDLNSASNLTPGTTVNLAVTSGRNAVYLDSNGAVQTFAAPIAIGTLTVH